MRLCLPVVFALLWMSPPAAAQDPRGTPQQDPVIVASGSAEVRRAPDRAWVEIQVMSRAKDPKEAQRQNADAMSKVMDQLKAMNLGQDAIRTTGYQLQPEFDYVDGKQVLREYVARNSVEVRVDEITRIGDVLAVAVGSGATSVGGLRFGLRDRDAAEREALTMAVKDARGRIDAAAAGAGLQVVRIHRIETHAVDDDGPRPLMRQSAVMEMSAAQPPPVEPGTIEITARVTVTAIAK